MSLSCCSAGEMHCLDAPFRLTTWANYITPALASPRVAAVRAANKMRPRAFSHARGRILFVRARARGTKLPCAPVLVHALEHEVAHGSIAAADAGGSCRRLRERVKAVAFGVLLVA